MKLLRCIDQGTARPPGFCAKATEVGEHAVSSVAPFQFLSECVFLSSRTKTVREVCGSERAAVALSSNEPLRWGCAFRGTPVPLLVVSHFAADI